MDIRAKVLSGLRWTVTARFASQLFNWVVTIIVIRILSPEDYGLLAMATVFIGFLSLLGTLGLDVPLVQNKDLTEGERRQIFAAIILANLTFFSGLQLCAPLIADFFDEPLLISIVRVLSIGFIFEIFIILPLVQLDKEISFKQRSIVELITSVFASLSILLFANHGFGVWSLVFGSLILNAGRTIGMNIISPDWCKPDFFFTGVKQLFSSGGFVVLGRCLRYIHAGSDKLIGGRVMGADLLGYYAVAYHLASFPIEKLSGLVQSIAFPAFSKAQQITDKTGAYFLKANQVACVITFPVFFGISCTAPELVKIFLGEKWESVILPLQILALVMPLRALGNIITPLLWGIGKSRVNAYNLFFASIIMSIAFLIGVQWEAYGLALSWIIAFPLVYYIFISRTCPLIGVDVSDCLKTMVGPAVSSIAMFFCVIFLNPFVLGSSGDVLHLFQLVVIGAVSYLSVMWLFFRGGVLVTFDLIKN